MKVLIVSGGRQPSKELLINAAKGKDLIIGADKGCQILYENNISPNYILGDFDSCDINIVEKLKKEGIEHYTFPKEKNYTDSELAVMLAFEKGATEIYALGFTGTRFDHCLGNFGLLKKALDRKINMEIIDDNNRIFLINKNSNLEGEINSTISFQAYCDEVKDLKLNGVKYPLDGYDLKLGDSRTISNEFQQKNMEVSFKSGILMVMYTKD